MGGLTLAEADAVVAELRRRIRFCPGARPRRFPVTVVGSVRRRAPRNSDIDLLVSVPTNRKDIDRVLPSTTFTDGKNDAVKILAVYANGTRKRSFFVSYGGKRIGVDLFLTTTRARPFALFHWTGPASYNIRTRRLAKLKGLTLNQYGLFRIDTGRPVAGITTEKGITNYLGIHHRAPERRR
ncbi:MAG: hypothetical protein KGL39_10995 [Patescibacteria group bacterium]|nr:hypothetical protein [Patescibacteria group bacterium]